MKSSQLLELINKMVERKVEEKLSMLLPSLVESVLTERYLRHLVSEQVQTKQPLKELMNVDEEEDDSIPEPMRNSVMDPYEVNPLFSKTESNKRKPNGYNRLAENNPSMSFIYEGVDPASDPESPVAPIVKEKVPEKVLSKMVDMNHMRKLAAKTIPRQSNKQLVDSSILLENKRKQLDQLYVGEPKQQLQTKPRPISFDEEDPFEAKMRELDSRFRG